MLSSAGLDCYEGVRFEKRTDGAFKLDKPSLFTQSEDGSVLFVTSEDERKAATFATTTGKGTINCQPSVVVVGVFFSRPLAQ